jgi:hypothetical protein
VKEIHGYRPELGLRVFTDAALKRQQSGTALMGAAGAMGAFGKTRKTKTVSPKA